MNYEDTEKMFQSNNINIKQELQTISSIKKCLKQSDEVTNKMTNILNNFESKINDLHDLIVPVYDTNNSLQNKYSSIFSSFFFTIILYNSNLIKIDINKVIGRLDNIVQFHNSVKDLSIIIQAGLVSLLYNYYKLFNI